MSTKRQLLNSTSLNPSLQSPQSQSLPESNQPLPEEIQLNVDHSAHSSSTDSAAHLDGIQVEDIAPGAINSDPDATVLPPSDVVPRGEWIEQFIAGFNFAGMFVQSLAILPDEVERARAAADAVYSTALEVESLRFLIAPGGKWLGRGLAVFMFIGPKVKNARAEIAARRLVSQGGSTGGESDAAPPNAPAPVIIPKGDRDEERSDF